jgi:hypothetical protein
MFKQVARRNIDFLYLKLNIMELNEVVILKALAPLKWVYNALIGIASSILIMIADPKEIERKELIYKIVCAVLVGFPCTMAIDKYYHFNRWVVILIALMFGLFSSKIVDEAKKKAGKKIRDFIDKKI